MTERETSERYVMVYEDAEGLARVTGGIGSFEAYQDSRERADKTGKVTFHKYGIPDAKARILNDLTFRINKKPMSEVSGLVDLLRENLTREETQ